MPTSTPIVMKRSCASEASSTARRTGGSMSAPSTAPRAMPIQDVDAGHEAEPVATEGCAHGGDHHEQVECVHAARGSASRRQVGRAGGRT